MKRKRNVIIVLRLAGTAGRDILAGILLFTRQRPHWHTRLFQMPDELTPANFRALADEGYDGVIMSEPGPDATAELLRDATFPIAFIGDAGPILSARKRGIAYIRNDDCEIGHMGARYLLSTGRRPPWRSARPHWNSSSASRPPRRLRRRIFSRGPTASSRRTRRAASPPATSPPISA